MTRLLILVSLCGPLALAAPALASPRQGSRIATEAPQRGDLERQVVVTIGQAAQPPLGRAGTTPKPYGAARRYAVTARARRTSARLAREYGLRQVDGWPIEALGVHCVVFEVSERVSTHEVLERLARDPRVESAQQMQIFAAAGGRSYDDPYLHLQHGVASMQVREAHRWAEGRGVTIAVVDSGVELDHPELEGRVAVARDFVRGGTRTPSADLHGTAVAGVIASAAGNGIGIVGVAPSARLMALQGCWEEDRDARGALCSSFTLAKAIAFAVDRDPDVLNLSLAGPPDPLLGRLLEVAVDRGIVIVAAQGEKPGFPSSADGVIVVWPSPGETAPGPARGPTEGRRLLAPSEEILTLAPNASYDFVSGGSFAAAHVSGIAALLLELDPRLDAGALLGLLSNASTDAAPLQLAGAEVNACAALAQLLPGARCPASRGAGGASR